MQPLFNTNVIFFLENKSVSSIESLKEKKAWSHAIMGKRLMFYTKSGFLTGIKDGNNLIIAVEGKWLKWITQLILKIKATYSWLSQGFPKIRAFLGRKETKVERDDFQSVWTKYQSLNGLYIMHIMAYLCLQFFSWGKVNPHYST